MNKLSPRVGTIILAVIALVALVLLAASLNTLELKEGRQAQFTLLPNLGPMGGSSEFGFLLMRIFRIVMVLAWLLLPFCIIYFIISKEMRKRVLRDLMTLMPILILVYLLLNNRNFGGLGIEMDPGAGLPADQGEMLLTPFPAEPEYVPPPDWVTTVTSLALAAGITLLVFGVGYSLWRRSRQKPLEPLQIVELEARAALEEIEAGGDLREVIQRCYLQMVQATRSYRNITRGQDMTPHEFQAVLEQRGLPSGPVHQLTELFEQVRYGGHRPGRQEERLAIASLSSIIAACQRGREA
jgi:hypothetical protein